jgi:WD40 repeat protein
MHYVSSFCQNSQSPDIENRGRPMVFDSGKKTVAAMLGLALVIGHLWACDTGVAISGMTAACEAMEISKEEPLKNSGQTILNPGMFFTKPAVRNLAYFRPSLGEVLWIRAVALSADGKLLAAGSFDDTAWLWDIASGRAIQRFKGHESAVMALAFSRDGKWLFTGSQDAAVCLWDVHTGKMLRKFRAPNPPVAGFQSGAPATPRAWALALTAGEKQLVVAHSDAVRIWDVDSGRVIRSFERDSGSPNSLAVSGDGNWLVVGWGYETASLIELKSGKELRIFEGHSNHVTSVAVSNEGKWVATGSKDGTACLWEVSTGKKARTFQGHNGEVHAVMLSKSGRWLFTASNDKTARVWEVATQAEVQRLEGHTGRIHGLTLSSDGTWLATGSDDKSARLWNVQSGKEIGRFEQKGIP